jgi:hypothetical protein
MAGSPMIDHGDCPSQSLVIHFKVPPSYFILDTVEAELSGWQPLAYALSSMRRGP